MATCELVGVPASHGRIETPPEVVEHLPGTDRNTSTDTSGRSWAVTHPTNIQALSAHPAAEMFPMLAADKLAELADSIRESGLREEIWLTRDGLVLDGRNRLKACSLAGVQPRFRTYEGDDPWQFVYDLNYHRRHLSESERAMAAAHMANAKHGGDRKTDQSANWPLDPEMQAAPTITTAEAAAKFNVSERSVKRARKVLNDGVPELADAVYSGKVAVSTAANIASLPEPEQREVIAVDDEKAIIARANEIRKARGAEKRAVYRERTAALAAIEVPKPKRRYSVIYADPPWRYDVTVSESRAIENHYPTMETADIAALEVPATDDAVLFMWATNPKLTDAFEVLKGWGFNYVTNMVWVKDKIGMGYYARQRHELLFIAKRGTPPVPEPTDRPDSVIQAPRGRHSAKPQEAYEVIERMYPGLPKIEMFCRTPREGWDAWGNEATA